jgi:hypothetical protein
MNIVDKIITDFKPWLVDTAERAGKTFLQVFVLQLIASGWFTVEGIIDWSILQKATFAAAGAGLSVISSALSKIKGPPSTASLVQPTIDEAKVDAGMVPLVDPEV